MSANTGSAEKAYLSSVLTKSSGRRHVLSVIMDNDSFCYRSSGESKAQIRHFLLKEIQSSQDRNFYWEPRLYIVTMFFCVSFSFSYYIFQMLQIKDSLEDLFGVR